MIKFYNFILFVGSSAERAKRKNALMEYVGYSLIFSSDKLRVTSSLSSASLVVM